MASASAAHWRARWLAPVGALLALALAVVVYVQWHQWMLLTQTMADDGEAIVMSTYRAQADYLRLRERWPHLEAPQALPAPRDEGEALPLRYEIFVSRMNLLRDGAHKRPLQTNAEFGDAIHQAQDFIARADTLFGAAAQGGQVDTQALAALRPQLEALAPAINAMTLRAAHHATQQSTQRQDKVRQHNVTGIALTLFLSVLTLAFAFIAMRQLRRLEQRRETLEELSSWLRESQREAHAANRAKSAFLANMSHEIRTPFQGLLGMLSLLRETGLDAQQLDYLRTATESADHLLQILNDILDMSKLESGRLTLLVSEVDLRGLVHGVESLMRPQAMRKGLALHIHVEKDVPERVRLDPTRVKQVLFNLLSNAIKFSDSGIVALDVRCQRQGDTPGGAGHDAAPPLELVCVVTDAGIGMNEATLQGLFKRFSQGDNSQSRRFGGAGLGLEISRDLARLMGGDIEVASEIGRGSVFSFRMPLQAVAAGTHSADLGFSDPAAAAPSLRVLVAEDHDINRQYLAALLESLGHSARFSANGQEAVRAVQEEDFDVVLMDLHMPVLDGVSATLAIRALPSAAKAAVPIIALTADAFAETRDRCLLAGMNDFLTKPVAPQSLAASLRRLFGAKAMPDAARATAGLAGSAQTELAAAGGASLLDQGTLNNALQAMPRERLMEVISKFLADVPASVAQLRKALRDAHTGELRAVAHALQGAALNLGLAAVANTASALQDGASNLPAHEVALLVQRLDDQLAQTTEALRDVGLVAERITR